MIEHITKEEGVELLKRVSSLDFKRIIITVPNGTFNKNYPMKDEMRHPDHKWEPSKDEFVDMIEWVFSKSTFDTENVTLKCNIKILSSR